MRRETECRCCVLIVDVLFVLSRRYCEITSKEVEHSQQTEQLARDKA
jgi:hypothetical protein